MSFVKSVLFFIVLLLLFFPSGSVSRELKSPLLDYLEQKALCNYERAMDILEEWTMSLDDPRLIETNIFRINELIKYPELTDKGIDAFNRISKNSSVNDNKFIKARIDMFLNLLLLKKDRTHEALAIRDNLGFIDNYLVYRPLPDNPGSLDNSCNNVRKEIKKSSDWFKASIDLEGKLDIGELFDETDKSVFYLQSILIVPGEGRYFLLLGKTGHTDILLDGEAIFSSKCMHGFLQDQYALKLYLSKGRHDIFIKIAGSGEHGIKLALRLTDEIGGPAGIEYSTADPGIESHAESALISCSFFRSLDDALKNNEPYSFDIGYLFHASHLNSAGNNESLGYFLKARDDKRLSSASNYYLGLIEKDPQMKESYLRESVDAFDKNIESLEEITAIKLGQDLIYEADAVIESIGKINHQSMQFLKNKALALMRRGWHLEALKKCSYVKSAGMKSCAYEIEYIVYSMKRKYKEALYACKNLYSMDRYDPVILNNMIECCLKTCKFDEADSILNRSAGLFPNNVMLRLKHAELMRNTKDPFTALPYLLHARKISPYNNKVLLKTGLVYHDLNNDRLALRYMAEALRLDPGNKWIQGYIRFINRENKALVSGPVPENKSSSAGGKDFKGLEEKVLRSYYTGDLHGLYDNIEKLLFSFPAEPESILYYYELARLAHISGNKRTSGAFHRLIDTVNSMNFKDKNIYLMTLKLELEKVLYRYRDSDAEKLSREFHAVRKWSVAGPYSRYGSSDMDYTFIPEILTINSSDFETKEILIQEPMGELDFREYLYPETGIAYASTTITCKEPVKIRIYSYSPYKLFINGKETIENTGSGIFRKHRIVRVWDADRITLMIKLYLECNRDAHLRVIITDDNDTALNLDADPLDYISSGFSFREEMDPPFQYFSGMKSGAGDSRTKDLYADARLARYFHKLGSPEAVSYYRASFSMEDPVRSFHFAEYLLDLSNGDNESAFYNEAWDIVQNVAMKYKDFVPAQEMILRRDMASGLFDKAYEKKRTLNGKARDYLPLELDYAYLLMQSGYEKEFVEDIQSIIKRFPDSVQALQILATYYKDRNPARSIDILKGILSKEICRDSLKDLAGIYRETGKYRDIIGLRNKYDTGPFDRELIESFIDFRDYSSAKKAIFRGLVKRNDPYFNIKLGEISYIQGSDPVMYWEKALSVNPSNYSIRDFLSYLKTGRIENPFKEFGGDAGKEIIRGDTGASPGPLTRSMIFILNEDGGSRLFCEDIAYSPDSKSVRKPENYRIPFPGEIHIVSTGTYQNGNHNGSIASASYYIDNPIMPKGRSFFSIPYININEPGGPVSRFKLKVIAPRDIKLEFSFNKEIEIRSKMTSEAATHSIETDDLSLFYYSFSNMNIKDFAMWYKSRTETGYDTSMSPISKVFAGKSTGETIKAVYNYVAREIELKSDTLFSPHKPADTLYNKKGSSEDKVLLARFILGEFGIKSYIAFAGHDFFNNASFISPETFTNILLYIPLDVKTGIWIDFSDVKYKCGDFDKNLAGRDAVVIIKDTYEIKTMPNKYLSRSL